MQKHRGIWLALLLALLAAAVLAPVAAMASEPQSVEINETNFPDETFRDYVKDFDKDGNDVLSPQEIAEVTEINVYNKSISDLTGIKYFTELETLMCYSNRLTSLDVSGCTELKGLICYNNQLAELDVSENAALVELNCLNNDLTSLDVSGCTELKGLICYNNQLAELDVSENAALVELNCLNNDLTSLDVSDCTALTYLDCSDNRLTSLDVSKNTELGWLNCSENQLRSLDVSKNTALGSLYCSGNRLTSLDLSQNTNLKSLYCSENQLTSLDVSKNMNLYTLACSDNQLTSLDLSQNTNLNQLYCSGNRLTSLDVSKNTALGSLYCSGNRLTSLDVSKNMNLYTLACSANQLTSLDVSKNTALGSLYCSGNRLTSLDVSQNTKLRVLDCSPQTARLGVNRSADGTWSANLAALVTGWTDKAASITKDPEEVWDEATNTVTWRDSGVQPIVTYDYDTGYVKNNVPVKMNVTLTLVPLGVGTGADVTGVSVKSIAGVISGAEITVKLPAGSPLPTAGDIAVTLSPYATMTAAPTTTDGGHTWTFTVTSEDEQTVKNYTLYIVYGVTVESGEDDHGTVTASPNPARMGDTVTLTVTPDPGYMLTGWEVVLGDVTVREDNTFVMPSGAVILRPIFAPIPATPPQTGDDSHAGLWLALALVSLGGLCAAAYAVRRRRSGGAR